MKRPSYIQILLFVILGLLIAIGIQLFARTIPPNPQGYGPVDSLSGWEMMMVW